MRRRTTDFTGVVIGADAPVVVAFGVVEDLPQLPAARAIGLACAQALDLAAATDDPDCAPRAAFLTPIAKAYGTDVGCRVADMGVQVHGGMGFIEETGAAQYLRDVRITPIYEGTNGIQAIDLVLRKMSDGGEMAFRLLDEIMDGAKAAQGEMPDLARAVWDAAETLREATVTMIESGQTDRLAGAMPYLNAFARVLGAHYHLRAAVEGGPATLARVHVNRILPQFCADLAAVRAGQPPRFAAAGGPP